MIDIKNLLPGLVLAVAATISAGCWSMQEIVVGNETGADTDTDSDSDGDVDTDADTDSDTDTDPVCASIPNCTEHTVDGSITGASSVYTADVDGDGDMDVLGAGGSIAISWWESDCIP